MLTDQAGDQLLLCVSSFQCKVRYQTKTALVKDSVLG